MSSTNNDDPRSDLFRESINELNLPTYISDHDRDMDALVASIIDDRFPSLREKLAELVRQAYRAGVIDGIEDDARLVVGAYDALSDHDRTRLVNALSDRANAIRAHAGFPESKPSTDHE